MSGLPRWYRCHCTGARANIGHLQSAAVESAQVAPFVIVDEFSRPLNRPALRRMLGIVSLGKVAIAEAYPFIQKAARCLKKYTQRDCLTRGN